MPKYIAVQYKLDGVFKLVMSLSIEANDIHIRKVYFPSKRSKSVRVSVRTEFSAANLKPVDYVGYEFPVSVVKQKYITVTLRRNHEKVERKRK